MFFDELNDFACKLGLVQLKARSMAHLMKIELSIKDKQT